MLRCRCGILCIRAQVDGSTIRRSRSGLRSAGVEDAHLHDLRAMALTAAEAQGKNPTALAGHTSPAQTKRYLRNRSEPVVESPSFGHPIDRPKKPHAE